MDKYAGQHNTGQKLFPPYEPFDRRMMATGDGHQVYVEQCGNPQGIPVVVLHGGPGGGCSPTMRRFFNPDIYRVVLFDQRGCGRSKPHASVENNTTWHLIDDIERIREQLDIDQWIVFGGSWGATLALIYAQAHPNHIRHLVLRGVFLATKPELDWFYGGGAGQFFPELWKKFTSAIPQEEQDDLIAAYHRRLFNDNPASHMKFAQIWAGWENSLASIESNGQAQAAPSQYALAFARIENHYFMNRAFLSEEQQILSNMDRIAHIPGHIVQGRFDMVCPPSSAVTLAKSWPSAHLQMVPMSGHALSEPKITSALVTIMSDLAKNAAQ